VRRRSATSEEFRNFAAEHRVIKFNGDLRVHFEVSRTGNVLGEIAAMRSRIQHVRR
jgi:hypothetical protein